MITPSQKTTIVSMMQVRDMETVGNMDMLTEQEASKLITLFVANDDAAAKDILNRLPVAAAQSKKPVPDKPKTKAIEPVAEPKNEEILPTQKLTPPTVSISEATYFDNLESHLGQAVKMVKMFQEAKARVLSPGDVIDIKGHPFIKRSGWRKIGLLFGVQWEIVSVDREGDAKGKRQVRVIVRASLPYGRYVDEIAVNNSEEYTGNRSGQDTWHNLEATATSRAINRAVSDLIGAGEVSAEEIVGDA